MKKLIKLINYLFLVKEIVSKEGVVHFRRYRLLDTPWLRIYIHNLLVSDEDKHMHNHPWSFFTLLLKGSYEQLFYIKSKVGADCGGTIKMYERDSFTMGKNAYHKITLLTPTAWTLFFAYGKKSSWGYLLDDKSHIDFKDYRSLKNDGKL